MDVWICTVVARPSPPASRGRQGAVIDHPARHAQRQQEKFERILRFAEGLPGLRRASARHLRPRRLDRDQALAAAVQLIPPAPRPCARARWPGATLCLGAGQGGQQAHPAGEPVHGLRSLLADLGTICLNRIAPSDGAPAFDMLSTPTPLQQRAFDLLGVSPRAGL